MEDLERTKTIAISEPMHRQLRIWAAVERRTIREIIEDMIRQRGAAEYSGQRAETVPEVAAVAR